MSGQIYLWPFLAFLWFLGWSAGALAQETMSSTLVIQAAPPMEQAVNDTYVTARNPSRVYDAEPVLSIATGAAVLLRFDLSRLPKGAEVLNASLELWVEGRSAPAPLDVAVSLLTRPWDEEAAWLMALVGQPGKSLDAFEIRNRSGMLSRQALNKVGCWYRWNVTDAVREQLRAAFSEMILLMTAEGEDVEYYLASSEWRSVAQRPRLAVHYQWPKPSHAAGSLSVRVAQEDVLSLRFIYGRRRLGATPYNEETPVPKSSLASVIAPTPISAATPMPTSSSFSPSVPEETIVTSDPTPSSTSPTPSAETISSEPPALTSTSAPVSATMATALPSPIVQAKIEALWPSGPQQVSATVYLFSDAALTTPPCEWEPTVRLWGAGGNTPARMLTVGKKRMVEERGLRFPVWDFTGVDVSILGQMGEPMHFFATVDGMTTAHNVVSLGRDVRTLNVVEPMPVGLVQEVPSRVDAWISILWPHGGVPAQEAERANLTAILFAAGTRQAFPAAGFRPIVRLHWAINDATDGTGGRGIPGLPREVVQNGIRYIVWDFNNLDVRAARNPDNRMYFWLSVDGIETSSTVWVHSVDGRPILPIADLPTSSCPSNG